MNFTVANHGKRRDASGYVHYDNVEFSDIPDMVMSEGNYCACKLIDEYRLDDNFDGYVDVIIIDVDETCNLEQAKIMFAKYNYWIITSKSHQKEKNGVVCDRFRIFIPLDKTIYIRQQMEAVYGDFINKYLFIDTSCRNVSRFFYSSPEDALVFYNEGKQYSTEIMEKHEEEIIIPKQETIHKIQGVENKTWFGRTFIVLEHDDEINYEENGELTEEHHLIGIQKFLDEEYISGQRAATLFSASCMMKRDNFDEEFIIDYLLNEFNNRGGDSMKIAISTIKNAFKYE